MVHHQADISLCVSIQGFPFWNDIPDQFVVLFSSPFFIGGGRAAVKDTGPPAALEVGFQRGRVGELRAVIGKQHGHEPFKTVRTQFQPELVHDVDHRLRVVIVP